MKTRAYLLLLALCLWLTASPTLATTNTALLSAETVVFQTKHGDIEFKFMPDVAPVTVQHMFKLMVMGCFQSNHFFRVDKGFVAQTADVVGGRTIPMNEAQRQEAIKRVPLEVKEGVKHYKGVLSMGRYDDPNSGESSFSMLLGDAPHLDMQYTIFGQIVSGMETLTKMEELPTRKEGIFVMPRERINIDATYWYIDLSRTQLPFCLNSKDCHGSSEVSDECKHRLDLMSTELERVRKKCLP